VGRHCELLGFFVVPAAHSAAVIVIVAGGESKVRVKGWHMRLHVSVTALEKISLVDE
jgi:hypothetical protein